MDFIDKKKLFGDKYQAFALCEYTRELKLLKKLIKIAEQAVLQQASKNAWSFEGVCHSFAQTIVDYSKMAYDNLLLGHFHAVNMICRSILENVVCLDIIINNNDHELWKYYWAYSHRETIYKAKRKPTRNELDFLEKLYVDLDLSKDFYADINNKEKAYIKRPYGWTYKINHKKQFNFEGVCNLIEANAEYKGFQLLSSYSHGTSFYVKMYSSISVDSMMNMFINLYINLYRMIVMYCLDSISEEFDEITEDMENIFYNFIQREEEIGGGDED